MFSRYSVDDISGFRSLHIFVLEACPMDATGKFEEGGDKSHDSIET